MGGGDADGVRSTGGQVDGMLKLSIILDPGNLQKM